MWTRLGRVRHEESTSANDNAQETATLQSLKATVLDRMHAAMLLKSSGHSKRTAQTDRGGAGLGPEFLRLANALSALYPRGSKEKRLLDGMLLAVPTQSQGDGNE